MGTLVEVNKEKVSTPEVKDNKHLDDALLVYQLTSYGGGMGGMF